MDERRVDQLSTTDVAETREASADASKPPWSWARPAGLETASPVADDVAEEAAGPPAPALDADAPTDARPSDVSENGSAQGISRVDPEPELEEAVESRDHESPELDRPQPEAPADGHVELMAVDSRKQYRARWGDIQTGFVDDPAQAVREADQLVADVMKHLATTFAEERGQLEERWSRGNEDTEHLRMALQRYRHFFGLLLKE